MPTLKKKKVVPPTPEEMQGIKDKIKQLRDLRLEEKGIKGDIKELQDDLLEAFERHGLKEVEVKEGRKTIAKGTWVQNIPEVLNEPRLKKRVGATVWNKITRRRLEKDLLAQAIKTGLVKADDVAACSDPNPSSPYIKTPS